VDAERHQSTLLQTLEASHVRACGPVRQHRDRPELDHRDQLERAERVSHHGKRFASDIGFEKFWNLKCRYSGLVPNAVVLVATVRALKMHGGGRGEAGKKLDDAYTKENLGLLEKGARTWSAHRDVKKSGVRPVVCINGFHTDCPPRSP